MIKYQSNQILQLLDILSLLQIITLQQEQSHKMPIITAIKVQGESMLIGQ